MRKFLQKETPTLKIDFSKVPGEKKVINNHAWLIHEKSCRHNVPLIERYVSPSAPSFTSGGTYECRHVPLREHLHAHKAVPYLGHSFLYFIDFIHECHTQIKF